MELTYDPCLSKRSSPTCEIQDEMSGFMVDLLNSVVAACRNKSQDYTVFLGFFSIVWLLNLEVSSFDSF